jgi:sortase system peptidoglycan-associated protein
MRTSILTLAIVTVFSLTSTASLAAPEPISKVKEQAPAIGMGTGLVIGAIIAGPVGAAVAGVIGAAMGNDVKQDAELLASQDALDAQTQLLNQRHHEMIAMRDAIRELRQEATTTQVAMTEHTTPVMAIESHVQFKTGSYAIEEGYQTQLDLIAKALKKNPQLQVRLTGHADQRGDKTYNQALSMQRAISVKQYLLNQDVNEKQVLTIAVGEEQSKAERGEETFFDRKVVVQVGEGENTLMAQR